MTSDGRYEAMVAAVYEAALEPEQLPQALRAMASFFDASAGAYWKVRQETGAFEYFHSVGHDPAGQRAYVSYFHQVDPGLPLVQRLPVGEWLADRSAFDPSNRSHREFVYDFCVPNGIGCIGGTKVLENDEGLVFLSLQRPPGAELFGGDGRGRFERAFTHLNRAARIGERLARVAQGQRLAASALDRFQAAVCMLASDGQIVYANRPAESLFGIKERVRIRRKRLASDEPAVDAALKKALALASRPPRCASALSFIRRDGTGQVHVQVVPVSIGALPLAHEPSILVVATDTSLPPIAADLLQGLFGLTPSESKVLVGLCAGETLHEIHRRSGLSMHTLRSYLGSIFSKTGTSTQAQLVALAKSLPVLAR